jgi:hypothetical protein
MTYTIQNYKWIKLPFKLFYGVWPGITETEHFRYENCILSHLRHECKKRGIPSSGRKKTLCERLRRHDGPRGPVTVFSVEELKGKSYRQLQQLCDKHFLSKNAKKAKLIERLQNFFWFAKNGFLDKQIQKPQSGHQIIDIFGTVIKKMLGPPRRQFNLNKIINRARQYALGPN